MLGFLLDKIAGSRSADLDFLEFDFEDLLLLTGMYFCSLRPRLLPPVLKLEVSMWFGEISELR